MFPSISCSAGVIYIASAGLRDRLLTVLYIMSPNLCATQCEKSLFFPPWEEDNTSSLAWIAILYFFSLQPCFIELNSHRWPLQKKSFAAFVTNVIYKGKPSLSSLTVLYFALTIHSGNTNTHPFLRLF